MRRFSLCPKIYKEEKVIKILQNVKNKKKKKERNA